MMKTIIIAWVWSWGALNVYSTSMKGLYALPDSLHYLVVAFTAHIAHLEWIVLTALNHLVSPISLDLISFYSFASFFIY